MEGEGEYAKSEGIHMIAYNDYTGNRVTKNGMHIDVDKLFLHRVGGVTSDMLFDVLADSIVSYRTFFGEHKFFCCTQNAMRLMRMRMAFVCILNMYSMMPVVRRVANWRACKILRFFMYNP